MFLLPSRDGKVEGRSDENPIYLSGVTVLEFDSLLQYLFKGYVRPPIILEILFSSTPAC